MTEDRDGLPATLVTILTPVVIVRTGFYKTNPILALPTLKEFKDGVIVATTLNVLVRNGRSRMPETPQ